MTITRDLIERRRAEIQDAMRRLEDQLNSAAGALQDCEYWLTVLPPPPPDAPSPEGGGSDPAPVGP